LHHTTFAFFFQAEDGIRDRNVTGVQTCALPISSPPGRIAHRSGAVGAAEASKARPARHGLVPRPPPPATGGRSRVGTKNRARLEERPRTIDGPPPRGHIRPRRHDSLTR